MQWKPLLSLVGLAALFVNGAAAYYDDEYDARDFDDYDVREFDDYEVRAYDDYDFVTRDYEGYESLAAREDLAVQVLSELATRRYGVDLENLFSRAANDPDNKFEVELEAKGFPKQNFKPADRQPAATGFGLYTVTTNGKTQYWRVYKTEAKARRAEAYYKTAADAGIPVGQWKYVEATIKFIGKKPESTTKTGVIVVDQYGRGNKFTVSTFEDALKKANFTKDKNHKDYKKLIRALEGAKKAGLQDPQGYLNPGATFPITFVGIKTTGSGGGAAANELLEKAKKWADGTSTSSSASPAKTGK